MVGTTLSHYKILEHLGSGGMGVVYKAEDTRLRRTVALKFLPPESTRDVRAKERFMREAQTASALQHNNICTIHDIDDAGDGRMFIVMDCYDGETLEERMEREPLTPREISDISAQIARGMVVAHERGIVHRDLKPSNIFLTRDGVVKIFDFGLAKLLGSHGITREGRTAGTVLYMSPEQLRGEEVDLRTDIWSFGVVLYRMLSGHLPFTADYEQALVYKIMAESPRAIPSLNAGAPDTLVAVAERCLEKDRALRPQSMAEILEKILGVPVPHPSPWDRAKGFLPLLALAVASVALILYLARDTLFGPSPARGSRKLAVLLFANQTGEQEIDLYRAEIQNRFVGTLDNTQGISVEDGLRVNDLVRERFESDTPARTDALYAFLQERGYDYVVEGAISRASQGGYSIHVTCKSTRDYETVQETFTRPPLPKEQLTQAGEEVSEEVLAYFTVEILDVKPEMAVWEPNRPYRNWGAIAQLNQAYEAFITSRYEAARFRLEQAIGLDSTFISPRIWLGPSLRNEPAAAAANLATLTKLRSSAGDFERAMIDWVVAFHREDFAEGVRHLRQALQYDSTNKVVLSNLAGTYLSVGDTAHALVVYDRLIRTRWVFPGMYWSALLCLLSRRDYAGAEEALAVWRSVDTTSISYMLFGWLSALYASRGDSARAQECRVKFETLCDVSGFDSLKTGYLLAGCYADFGLLRQSEGMLRAAVAGAPAKSAYHERLGDVLIARGDTSSGLDQYRTALRLSKPSKSIHYKMGALFEKKGDKKGARDQYRSYLTVDSTSADAKRAQQFMQRLLP